jgi:hypothetical protein
MRRLTAPFALALAALALAVPAASAAEPPALGAFGIVPGSFTAGASQGDGSGILDAGASPDDRAGGAPFQAATAFKFELTRIGEGSEGLINAGGLPRDIVVQLPPGFLGNPLATPRCSITAFRADRYCPNDTAVGIVDLPVFVRGSGGLNYNYREPVYNMAPGRGEPALFAFHIYAPAVNVFIHVHLDPARNYALTATVPQITAEGWTRSSDLALWGVPADAAHDAWRGFGGQGTGRVGPGCVETFTGASFGSCPSDAQPARAFLSNPADCDGRPVVTRIAIDSWTEPGRLDPEGEPDLSDPAWKTDTAIAPPVEGCDKLRFGGPEAPVSLDMRPASGAAATPSAYTATLKLPYNENTVGLTSYGDESPVLANPTLRDTTVTLPEGVVVNPSSANGLAACSSAQIGLATAPGTVPIRFDGKPAQCPDASKIGTLEVHSPLIDHPLEGAVYLAAQDDNPFHSLLAIYLAVEDPQTGIIVKLAGRVTPDPGTGQLGATFTENPQLPFTELKLSFFGGPHASLTNPATCGTYAITSTLTPWSAPQTPAVISKSAFEVTSGPNGGACAASVDRQPNSPSFEAGTVSPFAGTYSPFVLHLRREDGSQQLKGLDLTLPPGLTGRLAGVPYCSEQALALAATRDGRYEGAHPDCPSASQVGTVDVAAGAGPDPFHARGTAYLAGPYKGAPLSIAIVTPAVAGPFDLGTVVVRTALYVDPETARITARSDPLPTILQGIPLDIRQVDLRLDRPGGFTVNPTSCEAMSITGQATSVTGAVAPLSNSFQVGGCKGLEFKPRLKIQLNGATRRVGHPALTAVLTARSGEANIGRAQVNLPHGEFLDQGNLNKTCTRPVLLAGNCPKSSVYGHAKAWTPLLEEPLEGNVYLVGGYGYKLPALVAELNGQVKILLVGKVDSGKNKGIRNTFEVVPDAPVSRFELSMKGGKRYGLLENSENLCRASRAKRRAIVRFTGQNGAVDHYKPVVRNQCAGGRKRMRSDEHAHTHDLEGR